MARNWFEVDRRGLADIAKRRGMQFIITEPIQNAWDEDTTEVEVRLEPVAGVPAVDLTVSDDSPDGFRDMADSYMMFRTSYKLANPEQRGRFNIGEKLLLAVATNARITSTKGSVIFDEKGRRAGRKRTDAGTVLQARLRMTRTELEEAVAFARTLIPPEGVRTTVNGEALQDRTPLRTGEQALDTEVQGEEGGFKYTNRKCEVRVYEPLIGEEPSLYEMGIPVDTIDCAWHVMVMQKVPLSIDRGSIRFGYATRVARYVAEMMAEDLTEEQARAGWVSNALEHMEDDQAVRTVVTQRFGEDTVVYDPSDPEANKKAMDAGYRVVHGGELTKLAWASVRRASALKPAGKVFTGHQVRTSPNGVPPMGRCDWTPAMESMAEYVGAMGEFLLGLPVQVLFYDEAMLEHVATYGDGVITFNLAKLGHAWCEEPDQRAVDELCIHEFSHHFAGDHLSEAFWRACCRLGAKLRTFDQAVTGWNTYQAWAPGKGLA